MRQIIILIAAIIIGATTCNAQIGRGFTRAAKCATETVKRNRTPIVVGISVGTARVANQSDRQQHVSTSRLPHPYIPPKRVLAPVSVTKVVSVKPIHPCAAALSIDSINLYIHHAMVSPTDTTQVQVQDSITIK